MSEYLLVIANKIRELLPSFMDNKPFYPSHSAATFKALVIDAKSELDTELGPVNDYSMALSKWTLVSTSTFGRPKFDDVLEVATLVASAGQAVERKRVHKPLPAPEEKPYVDHSRIFALKSIQSSEFDLSRLAELCRELNVAAAHNCHLSTAMLLRAILDHVPPLMGQKSFAEVANNYGGERSTSFKKSMARLQGALRDIADMHLHQAIRQKEDLPTWNQVDFKAELDVLLGEIVRLDGVPPSTAKA